jgi:atypical dual specificity phosphatase
MWSGNWSWPGGKGTQIALGAAVAVVGAVALYRNVRNWTKAPQVTDQPLAEWVNNTDYDESFACDLLTTCPRGVSKYLARAFFYPTLGWTILKSAVSNTNAMLSVIDDRVLLGGLPRGRAAELKRLGVGLVINTCEEWDGNREEYERLGIRQVVVETIDYTAPQLEQAEQAVRAMQEYLQASPGGKVYVHCKAGRGRSATILICYYVAQGMTPLEAQRLLSKQRPQVSRRCWKRKVCKDFVKKHVLKKIE